MCVCVLSPLVADEGVAQYSFHHIFHSALCVIFFTSFICEEGSGKKCNYFPDLHDGSILSGLIQKQITILPCDERNTVADRLVKNIMRLYVMRQMHLIALNTTDAQDA